VGGAAAGAWFDGACLPAGPLAHFRLPLGAMLRHTADPETVKQLSIKRVGGISQACLHPHLLLLHDVGMLAGLSSQGLATSQATSKTCSNRPLNGEAARRGALLLHNAGCTC
jgi:hypothetical protein